MQQLSKEIGLLVRTWIALIETFRVRCRVLTLISLPVGATAALLAAASDSQSYSSKSEQYTGTKSQSGSSVSSIDAARAAELDHLVDAGDWEGTGLPLNVESLTRMVSDSVFSLFRACFRRGFGGS